MEEALMKKFITIAFLFSLLVISGACSDSASAPDNGGGGGDPQAQDSIRVLTKVGDLVSGCFTNNSMYNFYGSEVDCTNCIVFILSNTGSGNVKITNVVVSGTDSGEFHLDKNINGELAPGGTTNIAIEFCPTAAGIKSAVLSVGIDDPAGSLFAISLSASGISPVIVIDGTKDAAWANARMSDGNDNNVNQGASDKYIFMTNGGHAYVTNDQACLYIGADMDHATGSTSRQLEVLIFNTPGLDNDSPEQIEPGKQTLFNWTNDPEYILILRPGRDPEGWYARKWTGSEWVTFVIYREPSMNVRQSANWVEASVTWISLGLTPADFPNLKFVLLTTRKSDDDPVWDILPPSADILDGNINSGDRTGSITLSNTIPF